MYLAVGRYDAGNEQYTNALSALERDTALQQTNSRVKQPFCFVFFLFEFLSVFLELTNDT